MEHNSFIFTVRKWLYQAKQRHNIYALSGNLRGFLDPLPSSTARGYNGRMSESSTYADVTVELPAYALAALDTLEASGFEAWCVGGCVRDAILGRNVNDYDIATSAQWTDVERVLTAAGFAIHRTGIKHGTVTASLDGHAMEITTYRSDGEYSDGRHPDSVEFVSSIEEDLARRDFTINALAYHPSRGLLDCWGGLDDIDNKVIRAVGDPDKRFCEDALRILRGCRFASQLGFRLDSSTKQAMWARKMRMTHVSSERITHELTELLLGEHVHDALMECIDIISAVLPELVAMKKFEQHTPYHIYDVWEHTAWVVQYSSRTPLARWAALFHDSGKPGAFFMDGDRGHFFGHPLLSVDVTRGALARLTLSPVFVADVLTLVRLHDRQIPAEPKKVKRALAELGGDVELFRTLIDLKRADAMAQSSLSEPRIQLASDLEAVLADVLAADDAFTLGQLTINGSDIIALGLTEGPEVGEILKQALDAVIDERIPNERDALLKLAAEIAGKR